MGLYINTLYASIILVHQQQLFLIMAPSNETLVGSYSSSDNYQKASSFSLQNLHRTISDISSELREETDVKVPDISMAMCECCSMSEECTTEYISKVRDKFMGKLLCGLCGEAVKDEMEKNGGKREEALSEHMSACVRFNRVDRVYPVLYQAEAMREILKKKSDLEGKRAKSVSPRGNYQKKGVMERSTSCIPAISRIK